MFEKAPPERALRVTANIKKRSRAKVSLHSRKVQIAIVTDGIHQEKGTNSLGFPGPSTTDNPE